MPKKSKATTKEVNEVIAQDVDMVSSGNAVETIEVKNKEDKVEKIKKTFTIQLAPYVRQLIKCEGSKIRVTNIGFGDVKELNTKKVIYTYGSEIFDMDIIVESTSFPVIKIELF